MTFEFSVILYRIITSDFVVMLFFCHRVRLVFNEEITLMECCGFCQIWMSRKNIICVRTRQYPLSTRHTCLRNAGPGDPKIKMDPQRIRWHEPGEAWIPKIRPGNHSNSIKRADSTTDSPALTCVAATRASRGALMGYSIFIASIVIIVWPS